MERIGTAKNANRTKFLYRVSRKSFTLASRVRHLHQFDQQTGSVKEAAAPSSAFT
jgi:hypothetical protein